MMMKYRTDVHFKKRDIMGRNANQFNVFQYDVAHMYLKIQNFHTNSSIIFQVTLMPDTERNQLTKWKTQLSWKK